MAPRRVIDKISQVLDWKKAALCKRDGGWERALLMDSLYRYSGLRQREIGERMGGVGYSRVSRARKEIQQALTRRPVLRKMVAQGRRRESQK